MWSVPTLGTATTVSVIFNGVNAGATGDNMFHTDTSMGIEPAHLSVRPSRKAQASQFQIQQATAAFTITAPMGAVVDVHLSFKGSTLGATQAAQNASVAAPVGSTFWRGLDGAAVATTPWLLPSGISQF